MTTSDDELVQLVRRSHLASLKAKSEMSEQAYRRNDAVRDALAAGISVADLATALGVDRQRIYQMSRATRPEK